ncbi:MAG: MarR family transcriptional regulator [Oscillibacter sp.]|nr:MarR family transcriptional regulator [Oscillibacter sp.]
MDHPEVLGPILGHCGHLMKERMDARLTGCDGTPAQTHVLLYLYHHGENGRATQGAVTEYLKVKPSTANGILDRMVEKGLVKRTVSETDARQRLITMTDRGHEKLEHLRKAFLETEQVAVQGFSPEERTMLLTLLGRVIQNLEEDRTIC